MAACVIITDSAGRRTQDVVESATKNQTPSKIFLRTLHGKDVPFSAVPEI